MNKAKRGPAPAAGRGKKRLARKKPPVDPWTLPAAHCFWPPRELKEHEDGGLTFAQRMFVSAYVDNGGNGLKAYLTAFPHVTRSSAKSLACHLMNQEHIADAVATKREAIIDALDISREKVLRIQIAMATATLSEFAEVGRRPWDAESYRNLGDNEWALSQVETSEFGTKIKLVDRQAAINELWKKLGYEKSNDSGRERDVTGSVHARIRELLGKGPKE